uniref:Cyclin N-terminal domain-containing protein n=1 Tax=Anopheles melas TaxID=34690 RepID=A0A182UF44_9DIPT
MDRWNTFFNAPYCTEYDEDILETLKECESRRMNVHFISPQLEHRRSSVQLILNVCKQQSYRRATVHLAIYLLDVFMSNHTITVGRLKLVALTCLYLACKIEENDSSVPSPTRLNGFLANVYRPADFIALEVAILCFFDWHITIPTASTFLDIFAMHSFVQQDWDGVSPPWNGCDSMALLVQHINETSSTILEATLQHLKLSTVKPSLLAAGCIAAARCLTPRVSVWSDRLTSATGYEYSQIHEMIESEPACIAFCFDRNGDSSSFFLYVRCCEVIGQLQLIRSSTSSLANSVFIRYSPLPVVQDAADMLVLSSISAQQPAPYVAACPTRPLSFSIRPPELQPATIEPSASTHTAPTVSRGDSLARFISSYCMICER